MPEERAERYHTTIGLLRERGLLGQFSVQENGRMKKGFKGGLPVRSAYFDIFDRELMPHTDYTDPYEREKIIAAVPSHLGSIVADGIRHLLSRGIGTYKGLWEGVSAKSLMTPLGRQSVHIHYLGGGLDYIKGRWNGRFLEGIERDFRIDEHLEKIKRYLLEEMRKPEKSREQ